MPEVKWISADNHMKSAVFDDIKDAWRQYHHLRFLWKDTAPDRPIILEED